MFVVMNNLLAQGWSNPSGNNPAQLSDLEVVFASVVKYALGFAAIALFVMFTVGGFKYITAGSDPKAMEAAKKTLTYAIGGVVLLALAFLILKLLSVITNIPDLTTFTIRQ